MDRARRITIGTAATAALTLGLAGCGDSTSGADTSGDGTTLTWQAWSGSQTETDALNRLSEMVTEEHPDITIDLQTSTFPDYWTRLTAQASSGDVACLLSVQDQRLPLIEELLMPLEDEELAAAGIDMNDFNPRISEALQVDGQQVAVPYDFGPLVVFYNADAFADAALEEPAPGWTIEDFEDAAEELSASGITPYGFFPSLDQFTAWALTLTGEQAVNDDGDLELDAPALVETFEWLQELRQDELTPPLPATTDTQTALNSFMSGEVAMVVDGPWQFGNIVSNASFASAIAPMPAGPGGSASQVGGSGYGISESCAAPEEALAALAVITGEEALEYLGDIGRAYPARDAVADSWYTGDLADAEDSLNYAIENARVQNVISETNQVNQLFIQYGIPAFNDAEDVPTFLAQVQQQAGA